MGESTKIRQSEKSEVAKTGKAVKAFLSGFGLWHGKVDKIARRAKQGHSGALQTATGAESVKSGSEQRGKLRISSSIACGMALRLHRTPQNSFQRFCMRIYPQKDRKPKSGQFGRGADPGQLFHDGIPKSGYFFREVYPKTGICRWCNGQAFRVCPQERPQMGYSALHEYLSMLISRAQIGALWSARGQEQGNAYHDGCQASQNAL